MVAIGDVLGGKFRLDRAIGEGAMGVVYEARDVAIQRRVAVKVLASHLAADAGQRQRFVHEARAVARLRSPHVVHVFEVGEVDDEHRTPFYAMEHLEGRSVTRILAEDGPLPVPRAVTIAVEVLDALAEAHALALVHRDVKPDNLLVTTAGLVKVLDFGIVKDLVSADAPRTQTGDTFGTPAYMAPEQVRGDEPVDARTDLWAVGATLYEMLTGAIPFDGANVAKILRAILEDPPKPLSFHRRDVPPELEAVLARCLAKPKTERWPSASALAEALAPFAPATVRLRPAPAPAAPAVATRAGSPPRARAAAPISRALLFIVPFLAVVGAGTALGIVALARARPLPPRPQESAAPPAPPTPSEAPPEASSSAPPTPSTVPAAPRPRPAASAPRPMPVRFGLSVRAAPPGEPAQAWLHSARADLARAFPSDTPPCIVGFDVGAASDGVHVTRIFFGSAPAPPPSPNDLHDCDPATASATKQSLQQIVDHRPPPVSNATYRLVWGNVKEGS